MEQLQELCARDPDVKAYLQSRVFPIVTSSFEALLNEIDFRRKRVEEGEELPEIQPLLFLAQYLMRNNTKSSVTA
jgi:hypothetical protein